MTQRCEKVDERESMATQRCLSRCWKGENRLLGEEEETSSRGIWDSYERNTKLGGFDWDCIECECDMWVLREILVFGEYFISVVSQRDQSARVRQCSRVFSQRVFASVPACSVSACSPVFPRVRSERRNFGKMLTRAEISRTVPISRAPSFACGSRGWFLV